MLSTHDIAEQLQSIHKSIDLDQKAIELHRQTMITFPSMALYYLQIIATIQGTIATKQLQVTMLQLGLKNI